MDTNALKERIRELDGVVVAVGLTLMLFGSVMVGSGALGVAQSQTTQEASQKVVCEVSPVGTASAQTADSGLIITGTNFALNDSGKVVAVYATNGTVKWSNVVNTEIGDATVYKGTIYYQRKALNLTTGNVTIRDTSSSDIGSTPSVNDRRVFYTDSTGMSAYNTTTGAGEWSVSGVFNSNQARGPPHYNDGRVFVGTQDGRVVGLNSSNGNTVLDVKVGGEVGRVDYENGLVFAADYNGSVYAVDVSSGTVEWSYQSAPGYTDATYNRPNVEDGVVYHTTWEGTKPFKSRVIALDAETGDVKWRKNITDEGDGAGQIKGIHAYGGGVVFSSSDPFHENMYRLDSGGDIVWNVSNPIDLDEYDAKTIAGDEMFVTNESSILRFDLSSGGYSVVTDSGGNDRLTFVGAGSNRSTGSLKTQAVYGNIGLPPCEGLWVDTREYMAHNLTVPVSVYAYDDVDGWTEVTNDSTVTVDNTTALSYSNGNLTSTKDKSVNVIVNVSAEYGRFNGDTQVTVATETVNNTDILPPMQSATAVMDDDNGLVVVMATAISAGIAFAASSLAGVAAFPIIIVGAWVAGYVGTHVLLASMLMSIFIGLNVAQVVEYSG